MVVNRHSGAGRFSDPGPRHTQAAEATLPLSGPILSTVAVISFVGSWNGYLLPLIVLNSKSRYPWTLGLMAYQGQYMTSWQLVLAFITLTILPAIIMFLMAQRYIVAGLTAGAIKA